jgi:hypothetical protein
VGIELFAQSLELSPESFTFFKQFQGALFPDDPSSIFHGRRSLDEKAFFHYQMSLMHEFFLSSEMHR